MAEGIGITRKRGAWWPIGLAIVVALGVAAWFVNARPNLFPKNFGEVDPGKVYRSGQLTPEAFRRVVEEHQIKTIIDLGSGKDDPAVEKLNASVATSLGVKRCVGALEGDGTGNPNWYVWALRLAREDSQAPGDAGR